MTEPDSVERQDPSSPLSRFMRVFAQPDSLFRELAEHPRALGAILVGIVLSVLGTALIPIGVWEQALLSDALGTGAELPENPATMARVIWVVTLFTAVVAWPLLALVSSGLFALVFLFVFGYRGDFRRIFSVVSHALLVVAVGGLLLVPARVLSGDISFSLSMATLLPFAGGGLVGRYLELMDLFNLWAYALIGMGAAVVDGTRTQGHGIAVAVGTALLLSLPIAAVMAALGGGS
jgi:hypothetical protein